jgi:hypothetical protein
VVETPPRVRGCRPTGYGRGRAGCVLPGPERDPTMKTSMTITAAKVLTAVAFLAAIGAPKKW